MKAHPGVRFGVLLAVVALVLACTGSGDPAATSRPSATAPPTPTPTPIPDAAALLADTADNLRAMRSAEFEVLHKAGAIFVPPFSAKITGATGAWDANAGATLAVDAHLVPDAETAVDSGIYVELRAVITLDAQYVTDPVSGAWFKQSAEALPIPVDRFNTAVADLIDSIVDPSLRGREHIDGSDAHRISGDLPAAELEWLMLSAKEGQSVRTEVWTDAAGLQLRKLRLTGAVGSFDAPDTVREILLTNINGPVSIEPPTEFTDLTGG